MTKCLGTEQWNINKNSSITKVAYKLALIQKNTNNQMLVEYDETDIIYYY